MIDILVRISNIAAAKTAMSNWLAKDENNADVWRLPTWCDILSVDAYTTLATYDSEGNQLTPAVLATGKWFIVSLDRDVKLPKAAEAAIKAQANREDGLKLPSGIAGLSTIWAGMRLA